MNQYVGWSLAREGWVGSYFDNDILCDLNTVSYIDCGEYCGAQK